MKALEDGANSPFVAAVFTCVKALGKKMINPLSFEVCSLVIFKYVKYTSEAGM